eukprot:4552248-Pyramimonas_sp.AAC.1
MSSEPVPLSTLPSMSEFQLACRQSKRAAPGCDGITVGLVHEFATDLAALYYPLQLKCFVTLVEPLQWKGGYYRGLLKSATSDPSQC